MRSCFSYVAETLGERDVPHSAQNLAPGSLRVPHDVQKFGNVSLATGACVGWMALSCACCCWSSVSRRSSRLNCRNRSAAPSRFSFRLPRHPRNDITARTSEIPPQIRRSGNSPLFANPNMPARTKRTTDTIGTGRTRPHAISQRNAISKPTAAACPPVSSSATSLSTEMMNV